MPDSCTVYYLPHMPQEAQMKKRWICKAQAVAASLDSHLPIITEKQVNTTPLSHLQQVHTVQDATHWGVRGLMQSVCGCFTDYCTCHAQICRLRIYVYGRSAEEGKLRTCHVCCTRAGLYMKLDPLECWWHWLVMPWLQQCIGSTIIGRSTETLPLPTFLVWYKAKSSHTLAFPQ